MPSPTRKERPSWTMSVWAHTTQVGQLSTIAAVGNNGVGLAGIAWGGSVKLLGCKFTNGVYDSASVSRAGKCLRWCREQGAMIASNSWHFEEPVDEYMEELRTYLDSGGLSIYASGIDGLPINGTPIYPGAYQMPSMIGVAAIDPSNNQVLRDESRSANATYHVLAPGKNIYSTWRGNEYLSDSGSDAAVPHVAGAAALLWSYRPALTATEVMSLILDNVDMIDGVGGLSRSVGVIKLHRALEAAQQQYSGGMRTNELPTLNRGFWNADSCFFRHDLSWELTFDNPCLFGKRGILQPGIDREPDTQGFCSWWFAGRAWSPGTTYALTFKRWSSETSPRRPAWLKDRLGWNRDARS
eukprot:363016-Chlamydomonas_euryale.AAC.1